MTDAAPTSADGDSISPRRYAALLACVAFVVAGVTAWPWLRFDWEMRATGGAALPLVGVVDGEFYIFLLRRAAEGFTDSANHLLLEHRGPSGHSEEELVRWIASAPLRIFGGSAHHVVLAMTAVCAGLHALLFAAIARAVGASRAAAAATAAACCLVPHVFAWYGAGFWLLRPDAALLDFLPLARPVHPSVSGLLLWGGVLAAVRAVRNGSRVALVAAAAMTWLSWEIYRPVFPLLGAFMVGACAAHWLRGDRKSAAWTAALGAAVLALRFGALTSTVGGEDLVNGMGVPRRAPILTANAALLVAVAVAAVAVALRRRLRAEPVMFAVSAAGATLLVWNQQVVTGRIFQPFHYDWFWTTPFTWLALAGVAAALPAPKPRASTAVALAVLALSVVSGLRIQDHARRRRAAWYRTVQTQRGAFDWLAANAGPDDVAVFARDESARLYAAHTGRPVYAVMEMQFTATAPDERERRERRLVQFDVFGVTRDALAAGMDDRSAIHGMLFGWRTFGPPGPRIAAVMHTDAPPPLPAATRDEILAAWDALRARPDAERRTLHRLDWIVWTDDAPKEFREPTDLPLAAKGPGWRIRRVR
ncbi:MAG: hypothetical protein HMLKMBBP_00174 [Planctomycetes bacterium]|nr:hypothetical protein [Planctomycetota bacterium]